MVNITFLTSTGTLGVRANRATTSMASNSLYLYFNDDTDARSVEDRIKRYGFVTEHTENAIRIKNFNDLDVTFD